MSKNKSSTTILSVAAIAFFAAILLMPTMAMAQKPPKEFQGNPAYQNKQPPVVNFDSNFASSTSFTLVGLSNFKTVEAKLVVSYSITTTCTPPGKFGTDDIAPGQTKSGTDSKSTGPIPVTQSGQVTVPGISITTAEITPTPQDLQGACPNPKWTPHVEDISITNAVLEIYLDNKLWDTVTKFG